MRTKVAGVLPYRSSHTYQFIFVTFQAKGKAFAASENQRLKDIFSAIDTSKDGSIQVDEIKAAVEKVGLASVDTEKLVAAVEASGGTLDFEGWKAAIKESGGAAFGEMLGRYIGADGKMHLFAA